MAKKHSSTKTASHPRNYFQFTGIGSTRRKFGDFSDVNWNTTVDEHGAREYCLRFVDEVVRRDGFLDVAFSTQNPMFRSYLTKDTDIRNDTTMTDLFDGNTAMARVPFRAILGISSGADSSMTAELVCKALKNRHQDGIHFSTDQILLISFHGKTFNKTDSRDGARFGHYLKKKYNDLPIDVISVRTEIDDYTRIMKCIVPTIPKAEKTGGIFIPLDFHKASLMNQVAEAYNFLHVDTTNLTEEAFGETTDGTGGYGHISVPCLPKSMIYRILDLVHTPIGLGRNSVDTCTNQNKVNQYLTGKKMSAATSQRFFDVVDQIILMIVAEYSLGKIVKETGHNPRFVKNLMYRMYLALHREQPSGYIFTPYWKAQFNVSVQEYAGLFHSLHELYKMFNIRPHNRIHKGTQKDASVFTSAYRNQNAA